MLLLSKLPFFNFRTTNAKLIFVGIRRSPRNLQHLGQGLIRYFIAVGTSAHLRNIERDEFFGVAAESKIADLNILIIFVRKFRDSSIDNFILIRIYILIMPFK